MEPFLACMQANTDEWLDEIRAAILDVFRVSKIAETDYLPLVELMSSAIQVKLGGNSGYIRKKSKDTRNKEIIRLWKNNVSQKEIAEKYGLTQAAISQIITRYEFPRRKPKKRGFGNDDWSNF